MASEIGDIKKIYQNSTMQIQRNSNNSMINIHLSEINKNAQNDCDELTQKN